VCHLASNVKRQNEKIELFTPTGQSAQPENRQTGSTALCRPYNPNLPPSSPNRPERSCNICLEIIRWKKLL